jgi:adenylate cyclase class IV
VRVRSYENADGAETVLGWKGRTTRSPEGYKQREEVELPSSCTAAFAMRFLDALGFRPVHAIDRQIELWAWRRATLRIEWYPRMDVLLEVEGPADELEAAIAVTGILRDDFTTDPLSAFTARWRERTGRASAVSEAELDGAPAEWPQD